MANPPIVIGPFSNVPAPGSAIRSDWPQQISHFVWDNPGVVRKNGDTMSGNLTAPSYTAGQTPNAATSTPGVIVEALGRLSSTVTTNTQNITLTRVGAAADIPGQQFMRFGRSTPNTGVGSIALVDGSTIVYNTTSDYRLKDEIGPIADPLDRVLALRPIRFAWKIDGNQRDGFIAHEVADVVPEAVTGAKDAVLPDDDEYNPGGIDPQQLDESRLIPLLVAALQELTARVAELEAR